MRAVRIALAALIGVAGSLIGAPAFAAGANLNLDPTHGGARSTITVSYQYTGFGGGFCPVNGARVVFAWDGAQVGQTQLDPQVCGAQVHMRPPKGHRGAGQHQVSAAIAGFPGSQADSVYTVDGGNATQSPTPAMQANQNQAPTPTDTATTDPMMGGDSMSPAPTATDSTPMAAPAAAGSTGTAATTTVANVQPAWVTWALIAGALLVLAGAGTLGTVIVRSRREKVQYPEHPEYPEYDNPLFSR